MHAKTIESARQRKRDHDPHTRAPRHTRPPHRRASESTPPNSSYSLTFPTAPSVPLTAPLTAPLTSSLTLLVFPAPPSLATLCRRPASGPHSSPPGAGLPRFVWAGRGRGSQRVSGGPPILESPGAKPNPGREAGRPPGDPRRPPTRNHHPETTTSKPSPADHYPGSRLLVSDRRSGPSTDGEHGLGKNEHLRTSDRSRANRNRSLRVTSAG